MANINGTNNGEALNGTSESDNIRGFGGNDTINGGPGGDVVDGGDGNDYLIAGASDTIKGGAGVDTLEVTHFGSVAALDLSLMTATNTVTISNGIRVSGIEVVNIFTGAFNDHIRNGDVGAFISAGGGNDTVISGADHDYIRGGLGDDSLTAGGGFDRIGFYSEAANGCTVDLRLQGQRQNTGAGMDFLAGFEHVSGTSKADTIIGDNGANILWGSGDGTSAPDGFDVLTGNGGDDLIWTSDGNHTLNGGDGIDTLTLWGNGSDTTAGVTLDLNLQGSGAQDTGVGQMVIRNFENLTGSIHADQLIGDRFANTLGGGRGGDTLLGGASADVLYGDGSIGPDWPTAMSGPIGEFAQSHDGVNVEAGSDVLDGGKGDDILVGGLGGDTLTGGGGADTFRYYTIEDSAVGANDVVNDFNAQLDFLDLSAIDANEGQNGNQAFVAVSALSGVAGQAAFVYDKVSATTTVLLDTDGDSEADGMILMTGRFTVANMADGTLIV